MSMTMSTTMTTTMTTSVSDFMSIFLAFLEILDFSEAVVAAAGSPAAAVVSTAAVAAAILGPIPNTFQILIILQDTNNNRLTRTFRPRIRWKGNAMRNLRRPKRPNQQRGE